MHSGNAPVKPNGNVFGTYSNSSEASIWDGAVAALQHTITNQSCIIEMQGEQF